VLVGHHVFGVSLFDQTPTDESAQDALSQVSLRLSHSGGIDSTGQVEADARRRRLDIGVARQRLKHPINNGKDMYIGCKTVRRLDAIGSFESLRAGNLDSEQSATKCPSVSASAFSPLVKALSQQRDVYRTTYRYPLTAYCQFL
jgi:hypothetical protein